MEPDSKSNWRRFRRLKFDSKKLAKHASTAEKAGTRHAHNFIVKRWRNVRQVRRHMLAWLFLVALLIGLTGLQLFSYQKSYSKTVSTPGGIYAEGVIGPITTMNPLFATTKAERSASHLVFSSLISYDEKNNLRGDLAKSWHEEQGGKRYVVDLHKNLTWQDGYPLTAKDVVFTVNLMQNPAVDSPLYNSWQGIKATAPNDHTVIFSLPAKYSPFLQALTFSVLPQHILKNVEPSNLRASGFNTHPVGSGPFTFISNQTTDPSKGTSIVYLRAFQNYFGGKPKLSQFQLHVYESSQSILEALKSHKINAASDLPAKDAEGLSSKFKVNNVPLNNGTYAIFRTDSPTLKDTKIRQAIRLGTDLGSLRHKLHEDKNPLNGPILPSQVSGVANLHQPSFNKKKALKLLAKEGWKPDKAGILRNKKSQVFQVSLASVKSGDYPIIVNQLASQWRDLGIKVKTNLAQPEDAQQTLLQPRNYDVLVYNLTLGGDPDVYAYWHSSQATQNGLNLADYNSPIADDALLSARARLEPDLRAAKYQRFSRQWLADTPAIALYQSTMRYVTFHGVKALAPQTRIVNDVDRYRFVEYWTVNRANRYDTP